MKNTVLSGTLPGLGIRPAKNEAIETLRGLAIILVVAGHVIGIDGMGGMKVADDSVWRYLYDSLQYVRMPLFTAISGWVYALHPVGSHETADFMRKKARRLLLPMIFVGTLYFLVQYFTPGTNNRGVLSEIWQIYVFPYTVYWYLPSLFLIFAFVALLDSQGGCGTFRSWTGWLLLTCVLVAVEPLLSSNLPNIFSIWGAVCLMPFFLLGLGMRRFAEQLTSGRMRWVYFAGFCIGILAQQTVLWTTDTPDLLRSWFLHIPIGIFASAFLLTLRWRNRFLIWLGSFAYGIYLFHAFGTSAGRILLSYAGIHSSLAVFGLSLLLGLGIPIVVEVVLKYFPLLQTLFLGKKLQFRKK